MMVDRSRCIGRRTADAVFGDLSDGRAGSDAVGLRHGELEHLAAVLALPGLPGHVLRMARPAGERRAGVVRGPLACAVALPASQRPGAGGCDRCGAPAVSASGAAQAADRAPAPGTRAALAGRL